MTGIVLNIASVALITEHRNDFLNELEGTSTILKNEMRTSEKLGICASPATLGAPKSLYIVSKPAADGSVKSYRLSTISESDTSKLVLDALDEVDSSGNCIDSTKGVSRVTLTSERMNIQNLKLITSVPTADTQNPNLLAYISFEACDADATAQKIFVCDQNSVNGNPYRYVVGISTRNY